MGYQTIAIELFSSSIIRLGDREEAEQPPQWSHTVDATMINSFLSSPIVSLLKKTPSHLDSMLFLGVFPLLTKISEVLGSAYSFPKHFCLALWTWQALLGRSRHGGTLLHLPSDEPT